MVIRKVLVPLTGLEADASALAAAFLVARQHEAHVEAAFMRFDQRYDHPKLPDRLTPSLFDELATMVAYADAEQEAAFEDFETARQAANAILADPSAQTAPTVGAATARWLGIRPAERILRDARLADLVVLGRSAHEDRRLAALRGTVLTTAGRPLLLAPPLPPTSIEGRVVIAWNGGTDAARAVAASLPFLHQAETVEVLTAKTRKTRSSEGERLAEYLAWHGIEAAARVLDPAAAPVGPALLREAEARGARLLVMGGQGQTRLSDFLFGGVTDYVFSHATMPVLIAH
jgi:nucleotide-binding universal stress UspA family protein